MMLKQSRTDTLKLSFVITLLGVQILPVYGQSSGDAFMSRAKTIHAQRQYAYNVLMEQAKDDCASNPGKAEACFVEARRIAEELKLTLPLLNTLHHEGQFYTRIKQPDLALEAYEAAYRVFLKTVDHYHKAKQYYSYGQPSEMDDHARMFTEYANLLDSQHKSTKTIEKVRALVDVLSKSVEHNLSERKRDEERKSQNLDVDFGPCMAQLQRKINSNWIPLRGDATTGRIVICFQVNSNGSIDNLKMITLSDSETANEACMRAVRAASPLRPLPDGAPNSIVVQFTFDTNKK